MTPRLVSTVGSDHVISVESHDYSQNWTGHVSPSETGTEFLSADVFVCLDE